MEVRVFVSFQSRIAFPRFGLVSAVVCLCAPVAGQLGGERGER